MGGWVGGWVGGSDSYLHLVDEEEGHDRKARRDEEEGEEAEEVGVHGGVVGELERWVGGWVGGVGWVEGDEGKGNVPGPGEALGA